MLSTKGDIYERKSRWKIVLMILAMLIAVLSIVFITYVANKIKTQERQRIERYAAALEKMNTVDPTNSDDLTFLIDIIQSNKTIPVILTSSAYEVESGLNFGEKRDTNFVFLAQEVSKMRAQKIEPIVIDNGYNKQFVFYKSSKLLRLLTWFPWVQLGFVGAFLLLGYLVFSDSRQAEQNRVWVGLAKEAAHQLGTPISGIKGWVEYIKTMEAQDAPMVAEEIEHDLDRLERVTERFSKIGSQPELKVEDIIPHVMRNAEYIALRSPRLVHIDVGDIRQMKAYASINEPLLDWVFENLLKNALDAVGGEGTISIDVSQGDKYVKVDISDTGKGIKQADWDKIFMPGYSTKLRGWGLGLSLTKRIVETYHDGKIFVRESSVGRGTTIRVLLPKQQALSSS